MGGGVDLTYSWGVDPMYETPQALLTIFIPSTLRWPANAWAGWGTPGRLIPFGWKEVSKSDSSLDRFFQDDQKS